MLDPGIVGPPMYWLDSDIGENSSSSELYHEKLTSEDFLLLDFIDGIILAQRSWHIAIVLKPCGVNFYNQ